MIVIPPSPISAVPISTINMFWSVEADSIFIRTSNLSHGCLVLMLTLTTNTNHFCIMNKIFSNMESVLMSVTII